MFNIYVGNLSFNTTESDVQALFATYGDVDKVNVVMDRETGRPRGFCFVEMSDDAAGRKAIEALDNTELDGRTLKVNEAKPRAPRGNRDRW